MNRAPQKPGEAGRDRIRVLVADDHVTVREGLAAIIGRQPDMTVAGEAATGREHSASSGPVCCSLLTSSTG